MEETAKIDPVVAGTETAALNTHTFRRPQRRPSNLMQCMDEDGNIDAFRYIEYSRQRRMEFLKRADFICKMKSTLRMQQEQLLHRSASLPGMTAVPTVSSVVPSMANEVFTTQPQMTANAKGSSPDLLLMKPKSLVAGRRTSSVPEGPPAALRFMSRSASMPFVSSSFATTATKNHNTNTMGGTMRGLTTQASTTTTADGSDERSVANKRNAVFETHTNAPISRPPLPRRSLRKEEFEAAEALLFGMSRGSSHTSDKRRDRSSSEDDGDENSPENSSDKQTSRRDSSKKRKVDIPQQDEAPSRTMEMGCSVLSVVSTEEESGSGKDEVAK